MISLAETLPRRDDLTPLEKGDSYLDRRLRDFEVAGESRVVEELQQSLQHPCFSTHALFLKPPCDLPAIIDTARLLALHKPMADWTGGNSIKGDTTVGNLKSSNCDHHLGKHYSG